MRSYPEGNGLFWAIVECGFTVFCALAIIACLLMAIGGVR